MSQPNGPVGEGFHGPNLAYVLEMYEDFRALAHPSTEDYDDTIEAHYPCLGRLRPHACIDGWIFVGYIRRARRGERSLIPLPPVC